MQGCEEARHSHDQPGPTKVAAAVVDTAAAGTLLKVAAAVGEASGAGDAVLVRLAKPDEAAAVATAAEPEEEPEGEQAPASPILSPVAQPLTPIAVVARAVAKAVDQVADEDEDDEDWLFQSRTPIAACSPLSASEFCTNAAVDIAVAASPPRAVGLHTAEDSAIRLCIGPRESTPTKTAMLQPPVPPPPAPCFPISAPGVERCLNVAVDPTPCLVELRRPSSSCASSARTAGTPECFRDHDIREDAAPVGEECERLLPGLIEPSSHRTISSRSSPGASGSCHSRADLGDAATPLCKEHAASSPRVLARFLSPMSACAPTCSPSPSKWGGPPAPASSPAPVRAPALMLPAAPESFVPEPAESESFIPDPTGRTVPEIARPAPLVHSYSAPAAPAMPCDNARRTLFPGRPMLGRLASFECFLELVTEPSSSSSAGSLGCCCAPQRAARAPAAVDVVAASSIPATEARLLTVPRPSMRGLRATNSDALPAQLSDPSTSSSAAPTFVKPAIPATESNPLAAEPCELWNPMTVGKPVIPLDGMTKAAREAEAMAALRAAAAAADGLASRGREPPKAVAAIVIAAVPVADGPASLPALPRQAAALPSRCPSGDCAVDAAELLLARVVDPFGDDGH